MKQYVYLSAQSTVFTYLSEQVTIDFLVFSFIGLVTTSGTCNTGHISL